MTTNDGKQAYRILYLKTRTQPHRANLTDDYPTIQSVALIKKQQDAVHNWINKKAAETYVHIIEDYKNCTFSNKWVQQ